MQTKSVSNGKEINLTGDNTTIKSNNFNVDKNGNMVCKNATVNGKITSNDANITGGYINLNTARSQGDLVFNIHDDENSHTFIGPVNASIGYIGSNVSTGVYLQGEAGGESLVQAQMIIQTSLESQKKNIEKLEDIGLETIKKIDIYKYNFKTQEDTDKKHIGFVIGNNYNYSKEITNTNNSGVDNYAFTSLCCKAIQELTTKVEELENKIKEMEEDNG